MMKLNVLVQSLVVAGLVTPALAQETQRIEITGSSIKRVQAEGALPVQVIRAADLEKQGISNAEQLVSILSANGNGVDNMVSNQGGDFLNSLLFSGRGANNGASAVSLRGLGAQNTLVLLNGRRISTHGLNGKSVDLNTIPLSAIERIEILKDGASAIYGTDAIGGVMNFILKRDYTGLEVSGFADFTQRGGGDIAKGSITYGVGSLDKSGFNLLAVLALDTTSRLRGSQRPFHNGYQPERGLAPDTTGTPYATVNAAGGTALGGSFTLPNGTSVNRTNLLALDQLGFAPGSRSCESIPNTYLYRGDITGFTNNNGSCVYDYGKDWSLMQPTDRINLVTRGSLRLGADTVASLELVASRTKSEVEYTYNQITTVARGANYPAGGPYYPNDLASAVNAISPGRFNTALPVRVRWRCIECGPRQQETTSDAYRLFAGLEGVLAGWDYKLGLSRAQSKADTVLGDGNLYEVPFRAAMETGLINPFLLPGQSQTPQAIALINGTKAIGEKLYGGEATVTQFDGTVSGDLFKLPAGPLAGALGFDVRKESFDFRNDTTGRPAIIGVGSPAALPKVDRDVRAVFAELNMPIVKNLEAQLAVRHDRYSDFGSTTNPKVALAWRPIGNTLLLRGSYNKGFHAPDFGPLYEGSNSGQFNSDINDPNATCPAAGVGFCGIRPATVSGGNPDLKPEKSKQWSVGFVVSPVDWLSASVDFFNVQITDRISNRTPQEVIDNNLSQFIFRDLPVSEGGDGNPATIDAVRGGWINVAGDRVRGMDINVTANHRNSMGRWTATLDGTYLRNYQTRKSTSEPWSERVGEFGDFDFLWDLKLRWKHTLSVGLTSGDWTTTVTQIYSSSYKDEVDGYGSGVILQDLGFQSKIKAYTRYNLSFSYSGIKNTTLTAGITNLFDRDPPFSLHNVDNVAGAGWDARVGDPRGRAINVKLTHKFF